MQEDLVENNTVRRNVNRILRKAYSFDAENESGRMRQSEEFARMYQFVFTPACSF